jgi:O-antigen/teichoic acid export membrane protein
MRPRLQYIKEICFYGVPLVPHMIGASLLATADRFVAGQQLGSHAAGVYMVAAQLGMAMAMVADAFNKAFVPWLFENLKTGNARSKQRIVQGTWAYFSMALLMAGCVALLSPWIIRLCAGTAYQEAANAMGWIAFGQALSGMYLMVTNYISYTRKTTLLAVCTLISGALGVFSSWWLAPRMGVAGVGAGFAIGMLVKFLLTWRLAQRLYPMPWFQWRTAASADSAGNA